MDTKDSGVKGGVFITHQIHDGKHHYEVTKVMKCKNEGRKKMFVRRGDKLMEINGVDLQDVTPEELAQQISEGSPMLTVHKAEKKKEQVDQSLPETETFQPFSRESTELSFSWELTRDEEKGEENETTSAVEDPCKDMNEENGDLLIVHMTKTSFSVVSGRGCEDSGPCQGCNKTGCSVNDVVLVSESTTVTLVPRGDVSFRQEKLAEVMIRNVPTHLYLRGRCSEKTLFSSPNPERITIYYYKSNSTDGFRGMPVVLNLTGSNCFLRCCRDEHKVFLQIETCEKQRLMRISKSDECALSFLFYMRADRTKQRRFESALYKGWFIHIVHTEAVEMAQTDGGGDPSFLFIIQK